MVTSVEQRRALNWIDGKFVDSPARQDSINPATYEVIGSYADGGPEAAEGAIDAAFDCFTHKTWRTDGMLRATALAHLADAYQARLDELVDTICLENGKLRPHAHYEVHHIVRSLRFAAGLATQLFGRVLDTEPGLQAMSLRQPVGVAGIITPWNSPAYLSIRSLAPALATGCTAAMKMPGQAAQTAAIMSEIIASVPEIPAGAVNIFAESHGDGARLLVDSPRVQTVSFTGSTAVGREIAKSAGAALKRVGLELGGKTPHLVFADADLDLAIPTIVRSLTTFAGQFCMTGSRVLAESSIADQVRTLLAGDLSSVRLGPGSGRRPGRWPPHPAGWQLWVTDAAPSPGPPRARSAYRRGQVPNSGLSFIAAACELTSCRDGAAPACNRPPPAGARVGRTSTAGRSLSRAGRPPSRPGKPAPRWQ